MRALRSHLGQFFCVFLVIFWAPGVLRMWAAASKNPTATAKITPPKVAQSKTVPSQTEKTKAAPEAKAAPKGNCVAKLMAALFPSLKSNFAAGIKYLTLDEIAQLLQMKAFPEAKKNQATLTKGQAVVRFAAGDNFVTYQKSKIFLAQKIVFSGGKLHISCDDYSQVLVPLLAPHLVREKKPSLRTIVIDPGHGGKDSGAVNAGLGLSEKMLVLQIAKLFQAELVKRGYRATLTRDDDTFIELKNRPAKAKNADFFISLHCNSAANHLAHGVEVFTLPRARKFPGNACDPWNLIAVYSFLSASTAATGFENRGLKTAEFAVLKSLSVPGVLIEMGFLSNLEEARKLADPLFQKKIVQGLVNGIEKYAANLIKFEPPRGSRFSLRKKITPKIEPEKHAANLDQFKSPKGSQLVKFSEK
ncbi:MAG: N-acetylmuramoyl-L-alanine amidase [Puniceicoccales bacterium]|jgi:N-acetylmuramoyl-L-alanine amidase|nr:N-acetylmuramoyl-L-alanine amidase [Puniceicoccales bacterium]